IIVDDLVDTGGSLLGCIKMLKDNGAKDVYCAAVHGVFSNGAIERIANSGVKEFVITNTIERTPEELKDVPNLVILSVGLLLAKSIEAIADSKPISDVYNIFKN
nr:ribose-phosphate pyrophosphokinase [Erysipelotrichaceae bacterium]